MFFRIADIMRKSIKIPPQPQSSPPPPAAAASASAASSAAASKIPFRPRKIQKLTSQPLEPQKPLPPPPPSPPVIAPQILKPLSSDGEIELALRHLRRSDPLLSALIDTLQPPAFASSARPFLALARSILYQQLATKAAQTIYARFLALFGGGGGSEDGGSEGGGEDGVSPDSLLAITPQQLRQVGVSGRKAGYLRDLAEHYRSGALSDESILEMEDEALLSALTRVKGIGVWSVHMFMMFTLHRPDVLPVGDLGVRKGLQAMLELKELPKPLEMEELCEKWRPYRSVGSWYMWRLMESKAAATKAKLASASASVESC